MGSATVRFLPLVFIIACAPTDLPRRPAQNYQGPIAEGPILQADEYWIYSKADGTRMKLGAGTLLTKIEFPLWLGRVWKYADTASMLGGPETGHRTPVEIDCTATAFESITVSAGTFEAFRCNCRCTVPGVGFYERDCGSWNAWYAPQVKNIVLLKTENTATSAELLEYKVVKSVLPARPVMPAKLPPVSTSSNAAAYNKNGDNYRRKGEHDRAIAEYSEAIQLTPNYGMAYNNRGIAYRAKREFDRAIADHDQAIRLEPKNATFYNSRGNTYRSRGDLDRAIEEYNEALRLNPSFASAFNNRGITYARKLDYDRAITDYDEAIKLDSKNPEPFNNRGNAHRNKRDYENALSDYQAAVRIDSKAAQHRPIGIILFYLDRMAESAIALARGMKTAPNDVYAILWRYLSLAKGQGLETGIKELARNANRLQNGHWPAPVVDYYLGKIDQNALYAAAKNSDPKKTAEQLCEANFYAGEAALLRSSFEEASSLLQLAERDCPKTFYEWHGASVELSRLSH